MTVYQHAEAFCLMWYACECGHQERIWNSRDGVTPFGMRCPSCGGDRLSHTNWRADFRAPDYKPHRGQRFFADGTAADAGAVIERRIKSFAGAGNPVPEAIQASLRKDAVEQTGEWLKGWPKVCRAE